MALLTTEFGTAPEARQRLRAIGLDGFEACMQAPIGAPFKRKPTLGVYRLETPNGTLYLKRSRNKPPRAVARDVLRCLRRLRRAHTEAFHIHLAARVLNASGIPTMPILAWGEQRVLGLWPTRGFVIAEGVRGSDAAQVFRTAEPAHRTRLMRGIGGLLGQLHALGLSVTLRLHDLIVIPDADARAPRLVMIDLDFKGHHLVVQPFHRDRAVIALAHCAYLLLRGGDRLVPSDVRVLLDAYRASLRQRSHQPPRRLLAHIRHALRLELARHHASPALRRRFPGTPDVPLGS